MPSDPRLNASDLYNLWRAAMTEGGVDTPSWAELDDQELAGWVAYARHVRDHIRQLTEPPHA